jgi:hypothetical protein
MTTRVRVGAGTGFAGDRIEPAAVLAEHGQLDALVFECLAERTIALAQQRMQVGGVGYDARFLQRLERVLPFADDMLILSNAGAADAKGLAQAARSKLDESGLRHRRVAAVLGDDVTRVLPPDAPVLGTEYTIEDLGDRVVSANAYIGAAAACQALEQGADIVITGRMGDAALFAAPALHRHGWSLEDLDRVADATLVGHLLECAGQITGGYFADGGRKQVPGLAHLGFPYADMHADGSAEISKVAGTGGLISRATVLEQLLYEIDDPHGYRTPDVTLDLAETRIEEIGYDRVRISGGVAVGRPEQLKVSVGVRDGYLAVGSIGYAGAGAVTRAELALSIISERWQEVHGRDAEELRLDVQGLNALRPWYRTTDLPSEARARVGLRTFEKEAGALLNQEVEALYTNGPMGGGGVETSLKPTTGIVSTLIDRALVSPTVEMVTS